MKHFFTDVKLDSEFSHNNFMQIFFPWLIIFYLFSSGFVTDLSNIFAGILVLAGAFMLAKKRKVEAPGVIHLLIWLGLFLSFMVFAHAILGNDYQMLFNFQFENMRNLLLLGLFAALLAGLKIGAQGFWRLIIISGMYTIVLALLIVSEGAIRSQGWLAETIKVGNFGVLFSLLAIVAFFGVSGRIWKILAVVVVISGMTVSLLSQTRAGWVAFIVAVFILLWAFKTIDKRYFYTLLFALFVLVSTMFTFWEYLPIEARFFQAIVDIKLYFNEGYANTSVGARLDMWYIVLHAFLEKPIFGWGVTPFKETFIASIEQGIGKTQLIDGMDGFAQPHNDYMFTLYHFGLVGLLGVLAFLFTPIVYLISVIRRAKKNVDTASKQVILLAVAGLLVLEALLDFMVFNLAFNNQILHVVLVILFMVIFAIRNELSNPKTRSFSNENVHI